MNRAMRILKDVDIKSLLEDKLMDITFPRPINSKIVNSVDGKLYFFEIKNSEGLFNKKHSDNINFGRKFCDDVSNHFNNNGFFTSDELPRYGINRKNLREVYSKIGKEKGDGKTIVFLAYPKEESEKVMKYMKEYFLKLKNDL